MMGLTRANTDLCEHPWSDRDGPRLERPACPILQQPSAHNHNGSDDCDREQIVGHPPTLYLSPSSTMAASARHSAQYITHSALPLVARS